MYKVGIGLLGMLLASVVQAHTEERPFYRGGQDGNVVEAPNGARVNATYLDYWQGSRLGSETIEVRPRVHTLHGYHLVNVHIIEGDSKLIVIDTGTKLGHGRDFRDIIDKFSQKPIGAIIYTHHHYVGGAKGLLRDEDPASITVFGHPELQNMLQTTHSVLGPMQQRRVARQFGAYLPGEGPDAALMPKERSYADPSLNASGFLPVTHPVEDGEVVNFDGVEIRFHHVVGDTRDSLIIEFPELDTVAHNAAMTSVAFPLYTLRGDFFRPPVELIAGLDKLRKLRPAYLLGAHGRPHTDAQQAYDDLTAHRDAYSFIWNQSIRAINQGQTPEQMVQSIKLPVHLRSHPRLRPVYVDWEYGIRGIYRGMVGWYSEDGAELHPPTSAEVGDVLINGFGSSDALLQEAQKAFADKKYNLAAQLMSWLIAAQPDNQSARQLKADSLRTMAYATETGMQTRNFMLSEALHLEGAIDWYKPSPRAMMSPPSTTSLMKLEITDLLRTMESRIDPQSAADLQASFSFDIENLGVYGLDVRRGVAEFVEAPGQGSNLQFSASHLTIAKIMLGEQSLLEAIDQGLVTVEGDATLAEPLARALDI
ncbi:alkyl sulfatase dimerization domain-containing protein [Halopseudomonas bauzanensis]|uniref:alkyl sulfatase dimerization domain-containing protein n=1 Tax=Halopseudomonas bauzanensis TaxID=653930 RepID=UPI002556F12F|nr:alkyl sulfatase dimerization domain-containing protein [Halopseudomonas bauzanensis]